ncbi:MAG: hypothetical protein PHP26_02560 [Syntrophomonas sp.]|uniref:hypothetical protein n=1 Tax=Syntrophomonas sp. TaxID=2053627 RepID=UPI0026100B69|nr:hypothetical protein [Syntrophomonas sp.]MDD2510347.1 hypothetical protein [Syntrophomonas sp.]MDD3878857.1 hypothetical protein [Syntrophomonas sp.]MDD4626728.1 hypothetical protein [Syntrophomonas sp.]
MLGDENLISLERLKAGVSEQNNMCILVWVLVLLNLFTFIAFLSGFSFGLLFIFLLLAFTGIKILKSWGIKERLLQEPVECKEAYELMQGVKLMGEEIFDQEIQGFSKPLADSIFQDFSRSLSWLWEEKDAFIDRSEEMMLEIGSLPPLITSLSEEKAKLIKMLQNNIGIISSLLKDIKNIQEITLEEMDHYLKEKLEDIKRTVFKEKDIFYDYVNKLLLAQIRNREELEKEAEFNVEEYFNVNKLGEQFAMNLEKSLETRAMAFQDAIIRDMEDISADVVGKMQNYTMQLMNSFSEMHQILSRLLDESENEDLILQKRLNQCCIKITKLKDQAEEVMLTLAWQDILVEKRWGEIENQLLALREQINQNVEEDVIEYIVKFLGEEIPSFEAGIQNNVNSVFTKLLIDAELIYQLYSGEKLSEVIRDGVYPLLMFIEPVDYLVRRNIRISEEGLKRRKSINIRSGSDEYEKLFQKVRQVLESKNMELVQYITDLFPRSFYDYCNNPYLKQRPENLNQAAWALFIDLIDDEFDNSDSRFCLVGILLAIHQIRNKYIHPFKALPRNLENGRELEYMRYCTYMAIDILLLTQNQTEVRAGSA